MLGKFFFISILFLEVSLFANPTWFYHLDTTKLNTYVGYGSASDAVEAKHRALNDIVSQISVNVQTSLTQDESTDGDAFQSKTEFHSSQNANSTLYDYILLKSEYLDGNYFVAVEYENIPSFDKFTRKLARLTLKDKSSTSSYLDQTLIAQKLQKKLHKKIEFELLRKDKKWYIKHKSTLQVLDQKDFAKFFTTVPNDTLEIKINKKKAFLYDGDEFFFQIKSAKKGYVSVLTVYEDGTVSTLVRNIAIEKNSVENVPDEDFERIPQAGLLTKGVETFDLYVLLFSEKKMRFDNFAYADDALIDEEKYKNFDELINFLERKNYTTLKVITKPR